MSFSYKQASTDVMGSDVPWLYWLSGLQCFNMVHNGLGINLCGVVTCMLLMGNLHAGGQSNLGHLSLVHWYKTNFLYLVWCTQSQFNRVHSVFNTDYLLIWFIIHLPTISNSSFSWIWVRKYNNCPWIWVKYSPFQNLVYVWPLRTYGAISTFDALELEGHSMWFFQWWDSL